MLSGFLRVQKNRDRTDAAWLQSPVELLLFIHYRDDHELCLADILHLVRIGLEPVRLASLAYVLGDLALRSGALELRPFTM